MSRFTCKGVKQINTRISFVSLGVFRQRGVSKWGISRNIDRKMYIVGEDFFVLAFFHGLKILKVDGRDGRDPQNRENNAPAGRFHMYDILKN